MYDAQRRLRGYRLALLNGSSASVRWVPVAGCLGGWLLVLLALRGAHQEGSTGWLMLWQQPGPQAMGFGTTYSHSIFSQ